MIRARFDGIHSERAHRDWTVSGMLDRPSRRTPVLLLLLLLLPPPPTMTGRLSAQGDE